MHRGWLVTGLLCGLLTAGGGWTAYRRVEARRLRTELHLAARDLDAGRVATAHRRLKALAGRWAGEGEVEYRLGLCEQARGRREAALAAWSRVPADSPFFDRSAALQAEQLINMGRYGAAERVLKAAGRAASGPDAYALGRARSRLYRFEGRVDEVRRLLRADLPLAPDPAAVLKELWLLDTSPFPVGAWQVALDHADEDDERVWLGRANLATLTGRSIEAAEWLARCQERRPGDPAVWRAKLELARATGDEAGLWDALAHVPAAVLDRAELLALRAWILGRRPDRATERRALEDLVAADPGQAAAWDRLAALATEAGQTAEAERLRRRKAELDDARDRYRKHILGAADLASHADELARLAATLGRSFDSQAWSALRDDGPLPAAPEPEASRSPGATLAEALADLAPGPAPRSHPASGPVAAPPITPPRFIDDAEVAGLRFVFENGATPLRQLPETMSGGVGLLDYDGDGWLDVYVVQGGTLTAVSTASRDRLFRNRGDGTFEDATERSGLAALPGGYGMGVTVGDYDNDNHPDLFLTRLRGYALLHNRGDGTFEDATERAGLAGPRDNPTSAAFADLDGDGDLDLYVCHYMIWDPDHPRLCQTEKGDYFYCDPSKVDPAPDHVFRNDDGRFVDVTEEAGFTDPDGRGLGVVAADLDDDNQIDLYVANDGTANFLFHNRGDFRFEEVGHLAGVAGNADGGYQAGMGVASGDVDEDGLPDLLVTNFYGEATTFYRNLGGGTFVDQTRSSELGVATRYLLGFGLALVDYDNDSRLDVLATNGHVNDNRPFYPYGMPTQLMANLGGGKLADVSQAAGAPWDVPRVGRGLAAGDLDNDGRVDAIILPQDSPLAYFHNRTPGGHFVRLRLEGTRSNRDGVGARVTLTVGGRSQVVQRCGGGSYQSAHDGRLLLGLGTAEQIESIEVRWPSGWIDRFKDLAADASYHLREGDPQPQPPSR